jgi:O-antigen ligase
VSPSARTAPVTWLLHAWPLAILFVIPFLPETQNLEESTQSISVIYSKAILKIRYIDLLIPSLLVLAVPFQRRLRLLKWPASLRGPLWFAVLALLVAGAYGYSQGGENLFFDWRAIPLGLVVAQIAYLYTPGRAEFSWATALFVMITSVAACYYLGAYMLGYGEQNMSLGLMITVFDGPINSIFALTGALCFAIYLSLKQRVRWAYLAAAVICSLTMMLAFRRTYWVQFFFQCGFMGLLQADRGRRGRFLIVIAVACVLVFVTADGDALMGRFRSFNVFIRSSERLASTNEDHINDILDAWDIVKDSPFWGHGLGRPYQTTRIVGWKRESWGVHNAVLHVWVLYGFLGLFAFLFWHYRLFRYLNGAIRDLRRHAQTRHSIELSFLVSAYAWILSQFLVGLAFTPWQYSSVQVIAAMGFIWGSAFGHIDRFRKATNRAWNPRHTLHYTSGSPHVVLLTGEPRCRY